MQNLQQNRKLIESFLDGYNQKNRVVAYQSILINKETEWLQKRLQECLISFERCPTIAEILQTNTQETAEHEEAWQVFKKTCCNNYRFKPMEDWVYTIKRLIGSHEVEEMTPDSEKWVKKEFLRIYPALRTGSIRKMDSPPILGDGRINIKPESLQYFDNKQDFVEIGKQERIGG